MSPNLRAVVTTGEVVINWARVAELHSDFGDDSFSEIVEVFLSEVAESLDRLVLAEDVLAVRAEFHFLKGAALNLGFDEIATACDDGETRAANGMECHAQRMQVIAALPLACDALAQEWRSKMSGPSG